MKKFLLAAAAVCMSVSAFAATKILYKQNFETAPDAASTGWTYGGSSMTIASDEFGKFLELFQGQVNGRSANLTWGEDIYMKDGVSLLEDGTYTVKYDFCIKAGSNNQYNGAFTVFTNHAPVVNQPYRNPWSPAGWWENYLFDMSQVDKQPAEYVVNGALKATTVDSVTTYSIDYSNSKIFATGTWYTVTNNVNVNTRQVEYTVADLAGETVASGTRTVPETNPDGSAISMYALGMHIMVARFATTIDIDNIEVSLESAYDIANVPTVALTRVGKTAEEELNLNMRAYTITFLEGETLHVTGTDGVTQEVEYADCDGSFVYETTTSGTLKAWTTSGSATSEAVETTVECAPVALPEVAVTISSVSEGYGKTYTFTVDNSNVLLRPTIFIDYEFVGDNGEIISKQGEASGCKLTVNGKGTLKVTSAAFGYQSTTATVANDLEFAVKKTYDFARMTTEDIAAMGFPTEFQILNEGANMSGFNSWTARKRLFYQLAGSEHDNGEGVMVYDNVYPFGFVSAEETTRVLKYAVIDNASKTDDVDGNGYIDGLTIFPKTKKNKNLCIIYRLGIYNNETSDNYNNITVHNLDQTDFVVFNYINAYGANSNHPVCATDEEYFAQVAGEDAVYSVAKDGVLNEESATYSVTYPLYRIDTVCTKITVFKKAGQDAGVEEVTETAPVGDGYYYSIDGIRWTEPVHSGIYIHNGKKVVIRK